MKFRGLPWCRNSWELFREEKSKDCSSSLLTSSKINSAPELRLSKTSCHGHARGSRLQENREFRDNEQPWRILGKFIHLLNPPRNWEWKFPLPSRGCDLGSGWASWRKMWDEKRWIRGGWEGSEGISGNVRILRFAGRHRNGS